MILRLHEFDGIRLVELDAAILALEQALVASDPLERAGGLLDAMREARAAELDIRVTIVEEQSRAELELERLAGGG